MPTGAPPLRRSCRTPTRPRNSRTRRPSSRAPASRAFSSSASPRAKAQCLEGLGKFDEAAEAYDAFAAANEKSYLALTAKLGSARCAAQSGNRDKALEALEALKAAAADDEIAKSRIETTIDLVKRYEKREERSLFDAADAAQKQIEGEAAKKEEAKAEEAPKAEEPKAETPKAEEAKTEPAKAE